MVYNLKILPRAESDLNRIFDYIFTESLEESIAQNMVDHILRSIGTLKTFPKRWPEFQEYRQMVVGKYIVIYRIDDDLVQIVRVKHSAQYQ